ncbi:hypothetical protein CLOP_g5201, partial [Closterium sp. NIES-67]
DLKGS